MLGAGKTLVLEGSAHFTAFCEENREFKKYEDGGGVGHYIVNFKWQTREWRTSRAPPTKFGYCVRRRVAFFGIHNNEVAVRSP